MRHTREVIGAQLPELLKSRKGGKAIAPFRNQEGKVDMGKLAEAFGGKCSFTGEKLAGKSYGTLLLVNEWAWMAGSRFDRETAIQLAKAEGRKLQAEAERKAAEKERAARRRELAEIEAKAAKLAAEVVKAAVKPGDSPVVKVGEKDLLPIPTRTPQLGAPPRVDWDGLKRAAKGTPDPFTGEKMEKPSGFLVFFPSKGSGVAERLKTAGFRLLGETAAMMLRKFPSLLAPCGEEWRFVELSGFTNTVDGLLRQAAEDQVSSKAGTARHHQRKRQRAQVDAASHKKGPSAEVPMRPLTRAERRAPPPPEKPIWRKKNRK